MKCIDAGCKCNATKKVIKLWDNEVIGFCDNHCPDWLNNINIGELSPEKAMFGVKRSWYRRIK